MAYQYRRDKGLVMGRVAVDVPFDQCVFNTSTIMFSSSDLNPRPVIVWTRNPQPPINHDVNPSVDVWI